MNSESKKEFTAWPYIVGVIGSFLVIGCLAWAIHKYTQPEPLGHTRAAERAAALSEVRGTEADALNHAAWLDQGKGIVRLPIADAMKLVEREWKNPAAARSNLIARVEKATAVPPKAPEKPSQFE
jgi:hypothetical protein